MDFDGFAAQEKASLNKRIQPANPTEFLKWVTQTLRDQRSVLDGLSGQYRGLATKQDEATRALKNLDKLTPFGERINLDHMKDMHRNLVHKTRGVSAVLARCKSVIDETTANYQFVGETLKSGLADRHKKIAVQKELGLRLKDIDSEFDRCKGVIVELSSSQDRLSRAVQKLLNKMRISLPPTMRENINKVNKIEAIAEGYGKKLTEEKKTTAERKIDESLAGFTFGEEEEKTTNLKPLLAIAGGVVLGHILITKIL